MSTGKAKTPTTCDACNFTQDLTWDEREEWTYVQVGHDPGAKRLDFCTPGCAADWFAVKAGLQLVRKDGAS